MREWISNVQSFGPCCVLRHFRARGGGGSGRGPGRAGMARALARAVGEEKLRFGSVSSNPGRGGKKFFLFLVLEATQLFSGRGE